MTDRVAAPAGVVFLGSDEVAARCLAALAEVVPVTLVVSPPDRRRGRRGQATQTPVRALAARLGLPDLATPDVNRDEDLARIVAARPALLVVVAFGQLLREPLLAAPRLGSVNLHFSLLPRWRGAAPVQRAILAGDAETGVAVQRLVKRLDAGNVLASVSEPIRPSDTTPVLMERLAGLGAPLLAETVRSLLGGASFDEQVQDEAARTLARKIGKSEGVLRPEDEDAWELDRRIRAFGAWPGCRLTLERAPDDAAEVRVLEAVPEERAAGAPGEILAADGEGVVLAARVGALRMTRLQRSGGKPLDARAFLNGWPIPVGARVVPADPPA